MRYVFSLDINYLYIIYDVALLQGKTYAKLNTVESIFCKIRTLKTKCGDLSKLPEA